MKKLQAGNGPNTFLKCLSVESNTATDPTKLIQTENHRPRLRPRLHRNTTQHQKVVDRVPLPDEKRGQRRHPQEREERLVRTERWRFGVEEEPPEYPRRIPCTSAARTRTATALYAPIASPTCLPLDDAKEKSLFLVEKEEESSRCSRRKKALEPNAYD
ncbi:uncharacterized protein HKW66_Vig0081940 [Vigna angularis]|uniref:Uncharacterized protein n=1 Tax=Phaseolus angularis TaxID=3914 RepID=A0A8T0KI38_PHAAN|nr:uncharacterized protein HKW66_Vig0081940 [Vigna angularis]